MPLTIHGRFFHLAGERVFLRAVTYGPFPPSKAPDPRIELPRIAAAGFQAVRTYETPTPEFLDLLAAHGLVLLTSIPWHWDSLFLEEDKTLKTAREDLTAFLQEHGSHPALGALLIANEIRPDLVRFMGPVAVRDALEDLISLCHQLKPDLPVGYANFPTTEYLEPRNADFSAFNVYLEEQGDFERYLRRLHNIAGDRPLLLTEFGLNTQGPNSEEASSPFLEDRQAATLSWALTTAHREATAGFTAYAWSDIWQTGGAEVRDWSFGLTRRDGSEKPALAALARRETSLERGEGSQPHFSVAICTRNGGPRLMENLPHFEKITDRNFELIIIDDGSSDATRKVVIDFQEKTDLTVHLHSQEPSGLSAARNHAAKVATGEFIVYIDDDARPHPLWLHYLREAFTQNPRAAAAGGPNLPPTPTSRQNAIVTACPGNASHILFTDTTAEHLPGCNLALRRQVLLDLGGFDVRYHAAGDDVDVCWRLLDEGYDLAFHPAACVFHDRRPTVKGFLRQQAGYGEAEALLFQKHPTRFGGDGIRWQGFIYSGAALSPDPGSVIYHGPMGEAPYQMLHLRHMPLRPLHREFDTPLNRWLVSLTNKWAQAIRRKARKKHQGPVSRPRRESIHLRDHFETEARKDFPADDSHGRLHLLSWLQERGWEVSLDEMKADLEDGPLKLIAAETPLAGGGTLLHLRLFHPPSSTQKFWQEVEEFFAREGEGREL